MFCVDDLAAEAIRRAFDEGGELSAAVELRRHFPGIIDNASARRCARAIAGWTAATAPIDPCAEQDRQIGGILNGGADLRNTTHACGFQRHLLAPDGPLACAG
jgi:hypothetical protein